MPRACKSSTNCRHHQIMRGYDDDGAGAHGVLSRFAYRDSHFHHSRFCPCPSRVKSSMMMMILMTTRLSIWSIVVHAVSYRKCHCLPNRQLDIDRHFRIGRTSFDPGNHGSLTQSGIVYHIDEHNAGNDNPFIMIMSFASNGNVSITTTSGNIIIRFIIS